MGLRVLQHSFPCHPPISHPISLDRQVSLKGCSEALQPLLPSLVCPLPGSHPSCQVSASGLRYHGVLQPWAGRAGWTQPGLCPLLRVLLAMGGPVPLQVQDFLSLAPLSFFADEAVTWCTVCGGRMDQKGRECSRAILCPVVPRACLQGSVAIWCRLFEHDLSEGLGTFVGLASPRAQVLGNSRLDVFLSRLLFPT